MIYTIHGYEVVRVKVSGIHADSHEQAIEHYEAFMADVREPLLNKSDPLGLSDAEPRIQHVEYADETAYYLVDEAGDEEFKRSRWHGGSVAIDAEAEPVRRFP